MMKWLVCAHHFFSNWVESELPQLCATGPAVPTTNGDNLFAYVTEAGVLVEGSKYCHWHGHEF